MSFFKNAWKLLTFQRHLVGRDLQGNKYFEYPASTSLPRVRRIVKYKSEDRMYLGVSSLPIQWTSWLSHTRLNPPSLQELQVDLERQTTVKENARLLELQDQEEQRRFSSQLQAPPPEIQRQHQPKVESPFLAKDDEQPESWNPTSSPSRRGA